MAASKFTRRSKIPIIFLLLVGFTTFATTSSQSLNYVGDDCDNSPEQALSTTYKTNLKSVLAWLASDAGTSKGYNHTSTGKGINETVYGLYDCRGDVMGYFCQFCVYTAKEDILQRCPNRISAVIFYDFCILRYSNRNLFGKVALNPSWNMSGDKNISNPMEETKSEDFIRSLIERATKDTDDLFAMGVFDLNHRVKRYGLVQCSRDLNNEGCMQCLYAMLNKVPLCCSRKQGWQVLAPSCLIKYDAFMFYGLNNQSTSAPRPNSGARWSEIT